MLKWLLGPLPEWAQRQSPLLRYQLQPTQADAPARLRIVRILGWVLLLAMLVLGSIIWATNRLQDPAGAHPIEAIWRVLFFPTLALQIALRLLALSAGVTAIHEERRRQTWDTLRSTERGAALALRAWWAAILYRHQGLFLLLYGVRLVLLGGILWQLTFHRGGYLDILTGGITPEVALPVAVLLLSAIMTSAFLLPLTATALDAALGLLIATVLRNRGNAGVLQLLLTLARLGIAGALLLATTLFLAGDLAATLPDWGAWLLVAAYSALADWGLLLLQLGEAGEIWAMIPYGVFFGVVLLLFALLQAWLADVLLRVAIHQAETRGY